MGKTATFMPSSESGVLMLSGVDKDVALNPCKDEIDGEESTESDDVLSGFASNSIMRFSSFEIFSCRIWVLLFSRPSSYSHSLERFARIHWRQIGFDASHFCNVENDSQR